MRLTAHYLAAIESRINRGTGVHWDFDSRAVPPQVVITLADGSAIRMSVKHDLDDAERGDVEFVAQCRDDLSTLLRALRDGTAPPREVIDAIRRRERAASPGPWHVYLETDPGIAGSNVISLPGEAFEPDLYLWIGTDHAPSTDYVLVGNARTDIPLLLAALDELP